MSQLYDIYQSDTFHLARSIVIKLDLVSEAINKELTFSGYEIAPDSPASYKYYLNLSGEYHTSDHDILMQRYGSHHIMVDIATNTGYEPVPFTRELFHGNMANRALLNEYQLGSNFYNRLVAKYPQFETLIKGVLSPIDINEAINAPNGALLSVAYWHRKTRDNGDVYYEVPSSLRGTKTAALIQVQEHNLITELQAWVTKSLFRWVVAGYSLTDDLYVPFVIGILSAMLPAKIMNIRWMNAHTSYAHTFHIKEYLNSHGMLGKYVQFIPLEQVLYLYRNVRYLELNLGKTKTFHDIVNNMLTPTNVPMAGYYFKHDISKMYGDDGLQLPEGRMMREHINFKSLGGGSDRRDIRELLDRQVPLARENYRYIDNVEQETRANIKWSGDDELIVKVLESELTDIADPIPVTLLSQLTWFWAYLSSQGNYTGNIFVSNPVNGERIALTPLNAFILMIYCANVAGRNKYLEYIPNDIVTANWITKSTNVNLVPPEGGYHVKPSFDVMRGQTERTYISDETINNIIGNFEGDYYANGPSDFLAKVKAHHDNLSKMFFTICKIENSIGHGYGEHIWYNMFWHDIPVRLTSEPVLYNEWLPRLGIDFSYFTQVDYDKLSIELITECIGLNEIVDINKVELQRSMIEILKHFGSYTTHYLHSANQGAVTTSSGKYIRVTGLQVNGDASLEEGVYIGLDMFNDKVDATISQVASFNTMDAVDHGLVDTMVNIKINPSLEFSAGDMSFSSMMPMAHIEVLHSELSYDNAPVVKIPTPPPWTVLYEYTQYLSTPYFLFDNKSVIGGLVAISGAANDYPDVFDSIASSGLTSVTGALVEVGTVVSVNTEDTINTTGLVSVTGISEYISTLNDTQTNDVIAVTVAREISVNLIAPVINQHIDSSTVSIETLTGDVEDAIVVSFVESSTVDMVDVEGVSRDASSLVDSIVSSDISITTDLYDEPELIEDAVIIIDTVTGTSIDEPNLIDNGSVIVGDVSGDVVDDRTGEVLESTVTEIIAISGKVAEAETYEGGISGAISTVTAITGDVNDPSTKGTIDKTSGIVTRITGTSSDVKLPRKVRDILFVNVDGITGTSYDQPTIGFKDNASLEISNISINIDDDYFFEMSDTIDSQVESVTGEVYDEIVHNYGNHLSFNVLTINAVAHDAYVQPLPEPADISVVTINGQVTDIQTANIDASLSVAVSDVTGYSEDRLVETLEGDIGHTIDEVVMRVTDDVVVLENPQLEATILEVTASANDQTILSTLVDSALSGVTSIVGEVRDESTINVSNPIQTNVSKITGVVRDDRNKQIDDGYWHRVSGVTGKVVDGRDFDVVDNGTVSIETITGDSTDDVVNSYGSSSNVTIVSINGNMVDDNAPFYRMDNSIEPTEVSGEVYDEITSSYVDKTSMITFVSASGVGWDILPKTHVANNTVTIISITGETTDENE